MEPLTILLYASLALVGFIFQSLLHGSVRLLVYPLSFVLGVVVGSNFSSYAVHALSFNVGMVSRAAVGGYWHCVLIEAACLVLGIVAGFYLI
jgi:uncharacterized membrane protein YdfJ with MMPL/SSD domain